MQLINVALGGTLHQHLPELLNHEDHRRVPGSFDGAEHDVLAVPGTLAQQVIGPGAHVTRSHHHQGVDRLGAGLVVSARSSIDDLIEAIELPDSDFVLGVQWHPEADQDSPVIGALVASATRSRAGRSDRASSAF